MLLRWFVRRLLEGDGYGAPQGELFGEEGIVGLEKHGPHKPGPLDPPEDEPLAKTTFVIYLACVFGLTVMAGIMSGLTLGLMSMDNVELEVMRLSGTPSQRRCASIIIPLVKHHNFLLVTLLLCNAASTETLPLFLDRLADPVTAVIVSVTVVLTFGEILPQAVCSRYGLEVGAQFAWFVRLLMLLCAPVAWPVGKLLDFVLGSNHSELFRRHQLMALVDVHGSTAGFGGSLTEAEVLVIRGALDLTSKTASKSMTPLDKVFMLSSEDRLDERTIEAILISGHSRIPVYKDRNRSDIVGVIMIKEMLLVNPADQLPVSSLNIRELPHLPADTPMYDMLKVFESGKSHMALLVKGRHRTASIQPEPSTPTIQYDMAWSGKSPQSSEQGDPPSPGPLSSALSNLGSWLGRLFPGGSAMHHQVPQDEEAGLLSRQSSTLTWGGNLDPANWPEEVEPVGIITIEDVIEELLQMEIIDETDQYIDNMQTSHVDGLLVAQGLPPRLQRYLNAGMFAPRMTLLGAKQRMTAAPLRDFQTTVKDIAQEQGTSNSSGSRHGRQATRAEADAAAADQIALTTLKPLEGGSPLKWKPSSRAVPASPFASRHVSPFTRARSSAQGPGSARAASCSVVSHASGSSVQGLGCRADQLRSNSMGGDGEAGRQLRQDQLQGSGWEGSDCARVQGGSEHGGGAFLGGGAARDQSNCGRSRSGAIGRGERSSKGLRSSTGIREGDNEVVGGSTRNAQSLDSKESKESPSGGAQRVSMVAAAAHTNGIAPPAPAGGPADL
mmetsp:Transcript_20191/g.56245  ORF Transcript_20191/g.56245 Transcript_20191/m.56245 type:complete len:781 (+) Transcript_20191:38-2380(+)